MVYFFMKQIIEVFCVRESYISVFSVFFIYLLLIFQLCSRCYYNLVCSKLDMKDDKDLEYIVWYSIVGCIEDNMKNGMILGI